MLSEEERKKIIKSLKRGEMYPVYKDEFREKIQERSIPSAEKEAELAEINAQILASHNLVPESVVTPRRNRSPLMWAAAAVIVLTTLAGIWLNPQNLLKSSTEQVAENGLKVFSGRQLVKLPDGSTALLNENSELKYSQTFGATNREVTLIGEALFDVTHDPAKPFIVHTGKVSTTVLGTSFNVNSSQTKITVSVVRGLVQVGDEQRVYGKINPDEQIEVDIASNDFVMRNGKTAEALAWQKDFVTLDNVTMAQAAEKIGKRFNVKVVIANELKDCTVTAWFLENETLKEMVESISAIRQATATIKGNNVTIEGGIGCN